MATASVAQRIHTSNARSELGERLFYGTLTGRRKRLLPDPLSSAASRDWTYPRLRSTIETMKPSKLRHHGRPANQRWRRGVRATWSAQEAHLARWLEHIS